MEADLLTRGLALWRKMSGLGMLNGAQISVGEATRFLC